MLREFAQGAAQSAVQPVADFLAPTVEVPTSIGRYKIYSEKNRFLPPVTARAIGGRATVLSFDASDATYNCQPNALDFPIDFLELIEEAALTNALMEGATIVAEVAALVHEQNVINAAIGSTTSGAIAKTWSGSSGSDPIDDIDGQILNVIKAARYGSLMGVGVLFGAGAWRLFKNAPNVRGRFVAAGDYAIPNVTPAEATKLFVGNPEVRTSYMVVDTAKEGLAPSISFLLDTSVLIFARLQNPTRRDPSFMKTFRLMGNYMVPGSYLRDDGRVEVAKFDWSEAIAITNSTAAQLLTVS
jgi:hypothetical protein